MRPKRVAFTVLACVCLLPFSMGIVCAPLVPDGGGTQELTQVEKAAVLAGMRAAAGITQASGVGRNAVNAHQDSGAATPGGITVGDCPQVTFSTTLGESTLDVLVDFGTGCTISTSPAFACSGSAHGRYDAQGRLIDLAFSSIGCTDDRSLSGDIAIAYELTQFDLTLEGDWDLTYIVGAKTIQTAGSGTADYDSIGQVTRITNFTGTVTEGANQWSTSVDSLKLSFAQNGNFIPFDGAITVSGPNVRSLVIRFDENSPSTADVQVSVNGSAFFTINLSSL